MTIENPEDGAPIIDDEITDKIMAAVEEQANQAIIETQAVEVAAEEPVAEEQEAVVVTEAGRKKQNVIQQYNINHANKMTTGEEVIFPANYDKETREVIEGLPNIKLLDNQTSREWANAVKEGMTYNTQSEVFVSTLEDEKAQFVQNVEHNGQPLMGGSPRFKQIENTNLSGERAIIRLISHLGLGTIYQVPLWHSGIWITFKPPSESELVELNRLMASDKIKLGRQSYGLAFSNTTVYTTARLVDFALSHVYELTAKSDAINIDNIKNHISCQDINTLLWGFICTMYPRGFKYKRACTHDPEKCLHILEDTINVTKLQWTNGNALNDWQKTHMSTRQPKSKDLQSINRYREELSSVQKKKIVINEGLPNAITITIKTPSINEYIDAGHRWIGDIVDNVEKTAGSDLPKTEKDALIVRYGQATATRQYSHWIESIEYDSNIIDDRETVENTLDLLSGDDEIRNQFIQKVIDYINSSSVSVIGIPVYDCPACHKEQKTPLVLPAMTNIIPLDVMQVFFELTTQRLQKMTDR